MCNIGPEEIARRRKLGWVSLAITLALLLALVWAGVNPWWRLFVFFPRCVVRFRFFAGILPFLLRVCARWGFNFGAIGQMQKVDDELSKTKDKRKGNQITLGAVLIGGVVAIIAVVLI